MTGQPLAFSLGAGMSVLDFLVAPRLAATMKPLRADRLDLLPYRTREAIAALEDGKLGPRRGARRRRAGAIAVAAAR